jgi:putative hemolysin
LEVWVRRGVKGARQAFGFLQHPERFLITTLVGNNIAIVTASSLMAVYLERYLNGFVITAVSSLFLLFFGEILPKSIARERAHLFTLRSVVFLHSFYVFLYPFIWSVMNVSRFLLKIMGLEGESVERFFTREDLEMLVREGEKVGLVDREESGLISRFILRGNQKVREIMIPRTEITAIGMNETLDRVSKVFEETGYSRLPIMGGDIDEILGVITVKDVLLEKPSRVRQVMRDVLFVPEARNIASLLKEMQKKRIGIAIVVGEYGGTAGLVTLEDIVEEFFGEIQDEFDGELSLYRCIEPDQLEVNAKAPIEELNQRFDLDLPEGEYHTLGGFLMHQLGHIPKPGEKAETAVCTLVVLSASRRKVSWVRIVRKDIETLKSLEG